MELGLGDDLKLVSQTAYARDRYYSSQDYNRFVSAPVFNDSAGLVQNRSGAPLPVTVPGPTPGGIFTDPQLGASDRILSADVSRRAEEGRGGKGGVSTCRSRWWPCHEQKQNKL